MENCIVNNSGAAAYFQENQDLADWFLDNYYWKYFHKSCKHEDKYGRNLELIISPSCNLGCKYCYVHRFRDKIFDDNCFDAEKTITNLKLICEWMRKNEFNPDIEIFSGELFAQEVGYQVFDVLIDYYASVEPEMRCESITVPTNFTFICNPEATARVESIEARLAELGITLGLSASFDGKYMEQNRPYIHDLDLPLGGLRDDDYYERVFDFCSRHGCGFHPMVYSKGIEAWPKNFQWFQDNFEKFDIPWECIYLLQVRNVEWTAAQVKDAQKFLEYLYEFAWEHVGYNPQTLVDFLISGQGFNLLAEPYIQTGRGLTCGIQAQFALRVSDLMMYPCHRTGYKDFYYGQFVPDDDKVLRYENKNVEMLLATFYIHKESLPFCTECAISHLCTGPCLGSQYENTGNLFVPIPSVCVLSHAMALTNLKCLKKYGALNNMYQYMSDAKLQQLLRLERNYL